MLFIPVGHEEDQYRRLPVVAIGFMALCVLAFAVTQYLGRVATAGAEGLAHQVLDFAAEHPELTLDEEFLFATTKLQLERRAQGDYFGDWGQEDEPDPAQQATLDTLTESWRAASATAPEHRFGLVPRELGPFRLVSHMFVHAGWLHLIGNLFFFWLVGPPLEDVWGRPVFAAFVVLGGLAAGLLWCWRYPDSGAPVIGASGAIAALMGAFLVRFWRSQVRVFYVLWLVLRIRTGFFYAPAGGLLTLWLVRELALGSWLEPHSMAAGGVATWAHVFGFGAGAAGALALRFLEVEKRWVQPAIARATHAVENPAIDAASELQAQGRVEDAWRLLGEECRTGGASSDAIASWWDLALDLGRAAEVAPYLLRRVQRELGRHEIDLACTHWFELREHVPEVSVPPILAVALAEALIAWDGPAEEIERLLLAARRDLGASPPEGALLRLARTSAAVALTGTSQFCLRYADEPSLGPEVRAELRRLGAAPGQ